MANSSRTAVLMFIAGGIVGALAIYLSLGSKPKITPPPQPQPTPIVRQMAPCGQFTGRVMITVLTTKPFVDCQGVTMNVHDSIEWTPGPGVTNFVIDFKMSKKPFKDKNANKKGHFTEKPGESSGEADDPCPGTNPCAPYFPYSISVNGGPPFDPGVIITRP